MKVRLIVGCGYVGERVARLWQRQGDTVFAITRTYSRAQELNQNGLLPIIWDWIEPWDASANSTLKSLTDTLVPELTTILIAVSHSARPNLASKETHVRGLGNLIELFRKIGFGTSETKWIYLSTTGVFRPSSPGEWIDESSMVSPDRPGSIAALEGERWIASQISRSCRVVLRPAGIYGPGRVPRWQSVRDRAPLQVDPDSYLNLIHVDDLASVIEVVSKTAMQHQLYSVSDGVPVRRREYYETISELGNWPLPVFDSSVAGESARPNSRGDGNKRVSNKRLQSELNLHLLYPSYRMGLKSLLE